MVKSSLTRVNGRLTKVSSRRQPTRQFSQAKASAQQVSAPQVSQFQTNVNVARSKLAQERNLAESNAQQRQNLFNQLRQIRKKDPTFFGKKFRNSQIARDLIRADRNRVLLNRSVNTAKFKLNQAIDIQRKATGKISKREKQRIAVSRKKARVVAEKPQPQLTSQQKKVIQRLMKLTVASIKDLPISEKRSVLKTVKSIKQTQLLSSDVKQKITVVTQGTLEAPKKTKIQKLQQILTPTKQDIAFIRGAKGVARFVTDNLLSGFKGANILGQAAGGKSTAQSRIRLGIESFSISAIGTGIGRMVSSTDPFLKVQGLLSVSPFGLPLKIKSKLAIIDDVKPTFTSKINAKTGNAVTIVERSGVLDNGDKIKIKSTLISSGKTGDVKVTTEFKIKDKKSIVKSNLKNEGGFFRDTKTNKIIDRTDAIPTTVSYKITQVKTTLNPKRSVLKGDSITIVGRGTSTSKTIRGIIKKGKRREVVIERVSDVDIAVSEKLKPVDVIAIKRFFKVSSTNKKFIESKKISQTDLKKFLQAVGYTKGIIQGLDKRGRVARALGLRKSSPVVKNISKFADDNIEILTGKGVIRAEGTLPGVFKKKSTVKRNSLFISKKGNVRLVFNKTQYDIPKGKTLPKKDLDDVLSIPRKITIPQLRSHLTNVRKLKARGIIPAGRLQRYELRVQDKIKTPSKLKAPVKIPAKAKQIAQAKDIAKARAIAQAKKAKIPSKLKTKFKPTPRPRKSITVVKPTKPKAVPLLIPLPSLDFDSSAFNNRIVQWKGVYRERKFRSKPAGKRNPVVTKTLTLKTTKNRALKKVADLADRRTVRSITLRPTKVFNIKKKDIQAPQVLSKFARKKSKNTPVLKLVEKTKFIADKKSEIRELAASKRRKKK